MIAQFDLSKSQLLKALPQVRKGPDCLRQQYDDRQRNFLGEPLNVAEKLVEIGSSIRLRFSLPLFLRAGVSPFQLLAFLFQPLEDSNIFR